MNGGKAKGCVHERLHVAFCVEHTVMKMLTFR